MPRLSDIGVKVVEGGMSPVLYIEGAISGEQLRCRLHQLALYGLAGRLKTLRSDIQVVDGPNGD